MANQDPSRNPADESTLAGVIKLAVEKAMQGSDGMMPVEVVAYDRAKNRATVKHLVQMQGSNGEKVDRANVSSVRVYQFGNAAFSMSLPIKPGDKGWIMAADRDISTFQQDIDQPNTPNTRRMRSFSDGLFIPDSMGMGDVPAPESDRVVIGAVSGGTILSFDANGFYITVGGVSVTITAAGVHFEGGTVTHGAKNIGNTHTHGGITVGGQHTAVPDP